VNDPVMPFWACPGLVAGKLSVAWCMPADVGLPRNQTADPVKAGEVIITGIQDTAPPRGGDHQQMRGVLVGVDDPHADPDASPHGDGRVDHARDAERLARAPGRAGDHGTAGTGYRERDLGDGGSALR
jgi:hypothetical protein